MNRKGYLVLFFSLAVPAYAATSVDLLADRGASVRDAIETTARAVPAANVQAHAIFTIGGESPDFATISGAAEMLHSVGVSGPVTFLIRPGNYHEQVFIGYIQGAGEENPIIFRSETGDRTSVVVNFTATEESNDYVWHLQGARYVTLRDMTIRALDPVHSTAIRLSGNMDHIRIVSNHIEAGEMIDYAPGYQRRGISADQANLTACSIMDNRFVGGREGILIRSIDFAVQAETDSVINNVFTGQQYAVNLWSVRNFVIMENRTETMIGMFRSENILVKRNHISSSSGFTTGVSVTESANVDVLENTIRIEGRGVHLMRNTDDVVVANNFITSLDTPGDYGMEGIMIEGGSSNRIYHNSVIIFETGPSVGMLLWKLTDALNPTHVKNNILYNASGRRAYSIYDTDLSQPVLISDYNNFYSEGDDVITRVFSDDILGAERFSTVEAWTTETGLDAHSISTHPGFVSDSDLHAMATPLVGAGTPVAVVTDYDGDARHSEFPTIGADEFGPDVVYDHAITSADEGPFCDRTLSMNFYVQNNGLKPLNRIRVNWSVNGVPEPPMDRYFFPELRYGRRERILLPYKDYPFNEPQTIEIEVLNPDHAEDVGLSDNTISFTFTVYPPVEIAEEEMVGCNEPVLLSAPAGYADYFWNGKPGRELTADVSGKFIIAATDLNACLTRDTVSVFVEHLQLTLEHNAPSLQCVKSSFEFQAVTTATIPDLEYQWMKDDQVLVEQSHQLTVMQPGVYTVTTSTDYCSFTSEAVPVSGHFGKTPEVTLAGNADLCVGESTTLEVSHNEDYTYQWIRNDQVLPDESSWALQVSSTGSYQVSIEDDGGCVAHSQIVEINVKPLPEATLTFENGVLEAHDADTHEWFRDGQLIPGANGEQYAPDKDGAYYVRLEEDGCVAESDVVVVNITGTEDGPDESVSLYPIPTKRFLYLDISPHRLSNASLTVRNSVGLSFVPATVSMHVEGVMVDLAGFAPGMYVLELVGPNVRFLRKITIE